ncbi:uracil-DNA glycosylase [Paraburkholderia sp.]|uniref:uracil-DNA glycosylase n=1 Tax=Paraburkholderia sp. TaxID=1926495 RepID=UPI002387DD06|nr:uracil-DNA glycosylase [Paraburkholderia sp.]MDE1184034.1 uracil-DNA glycosylase [Paraburkholderia sp.]
MALHESALEEFGISPMWVRRGLTRAAAIEVAADVADVAVDAVAPDSVAASEPTPAPVRAGRVERAAPAERVERAEQPPAAPRVLVTPATPPTPPAAKSPQQLDAPPDDDFAWFDDLPANFSTDAPDFPVEREAANPSVQTLDWDALAARVANCEQCRLCEKRTNTVFGVGDRDADWMLIGEAPGEHEDKQGEPFVGPAGKLLDNMLRALTLTRDTNVYIANVIKCRPPGNRNPEPDEVARCEPYLKRQVALVKPKVIVAMGRFAAQSLLKTEASISSLRGRVHTYEGVPVIVTYHPAYLLRSLPDKSKAWADLCLARDTWRHAGEQGG